MIRAWLLLASLILAHSAAAETALGSASDRASHGGALRHLFLSNGVDADVFVLERREPKSSLPTDLRYPLMIFFGYFNNSDIYRLITQGNVLANAKAVGFRGVAWQGKGALLSGYGGWWMYDLSGSELPRCDRHKRLCY